MPPGKNTILILDQFIYEEIIACWIYLEVRTRLWVLEKEFNVKLMAWATMWN